MEFKFEIVKHIADLSEKSAKGWTKEFNLVKWGDGEEKYDIRTWNEDHTKCGKGVTLTYEELALFVSSVEDNGIL